MCAATRAFALSLFLMAMAIPAFSQNDPWGWTSCNTAENRDTNCQLQQQNPDGSSSGGTCNGTRDYGYSYDNCAAKAAGPGTTTYCWNCLYIASKDRTGCVGIESKAGNIGFCSCTETYRNCLIVGCSARGFCTYYD